MKRVIWVVMAALVLPSVAPAGMITTTFNSDNEFNGNMFDVTTFGNALTFTGAGHQRGKHRPSPRCGDL
jgi:hypothetical protein